MKLCIVGAGRCGSKLLGDTFHSHPNLAIYNETHWIPKMYEFFGEQKVGWRALSNIAERTSWIGGENLLVENCKLSRFESYTEFRDELETRMSQKGILDIREFADILSDVLFGSVEWGDKTPDYGYYMGLLHQLWPSCKFIHLIRDPLASAHGMLVHPGFQLMVSSGHDNWCPLSFDHMYRNLKTSKPAISQYLDYCCRRVARIRDEATRIPAKHYTEVRYEDLLLNPEKTLRRLAHFVDTPDLASWIHDFVTTIRPERNPTSYAMGDLFKLHPIKLRQINDLYPDKHFHTVASNRVLARCLKKARQALSDGDAAQSNLLCLGALSSKLWKLDDLLLAQCNLSLIQGLIERNDIDTARHWLNFGRNRFPATSFREFDHLQQCETILARKKPDELKLQSVTERTFAHAEGEVVVYGCIRNEIKRLPYFLEYHRALGVSGFVFVDNNSTDGTVEFLNQQDDCHVWWTDESYAKSNHGVDWIDSLLLHFAVGKWVLVLDADELLVYPGCESQDIQAFTRSLDDSGANALSTFMLDMYAAGPLRGVDYEPGQSFTETCPYFDATGYELMHMGQHAGVPGYGGVRERLFWRGQNHAVSPPYLPKVPLVKWSSDLAFKASTHDIDGVTLAKTTGVLLHFKLFDDFYENVKQEALRGEHWENAAEYKAYWHKISQDPDVDPMYSGSVKYENSAQLVELGLINAR